MFSANTDEKPVRFVATRSDDMRASGVLMHISSLPSEYGIGTMGREALRFIDFLSDAGQSFWQMLPIGPTSYGDSPYQSYSTNAGNPYFIDPELLWQHLGMHPGRDATTNQRRRYDTVDYNAIYMNRLPLLRSAFEQFCETERIGFKEYCDGRRDWLDDYALFMALKQDHGGVSWLDWEDSYRDRDASALREFTASHQTDLDFWKFVQYMFYMQWTDLREYAHEHGVRIIGDLPLYIALDSADVWSDPQLFHLDNAGQPVVVAGTPPDYFSDEGQLWGNPVYRWEEHKRQGYRWWIGRMRRQAEWFDVIRMDHFLGFVSYYTIPSGHADARQGVWNEGPGRELFDAVNDALGPLTLIAEDLGVITQPVIELRDDLGLPGMRVLQFAFDNGERDNEHMPRNIGRNCVAYVGTHDNPTLKGWWRHLSLPAKWRALKYFGCLFPFSVQNRMMDAVMETDAYLVILTMQDLLALDDRARMNRPGVVTGNWRWRMDRDALAPDLALALKDRTARFGRTALKPDNTDLK